MSVSPEDTQQNPKAAMKAAEAKETEDAEEESSWKSMRALLSRYWPILIITWALHLGLGLSISITGPTLPYLALNAGLSLSNTSFIYTVRSIVVCVTSLLVGLLIARLHSSRMKLMMLLLGSLISMSSALVVPHARSIVTLLLGQCLFGVSAGVVDTIDNMLVIFLFGPVQSRSLSHSLHFCVGIGGFLAPVLARPFLVQMGDVGTDTSICGGDAEQEVEISNWTTPSSPVNLEPLRWPYFIIACVHVTWIIGYGVLILKNFSLQKFSSGRVNVRDTDVDFHTSRHLQGVRKTIVVVLFVIFYILHVGQENVFWSLLYSFGVCSSLRLSPGDASLLSTIFFVGFLISRALGVGVARVLPPAKILLVQLTGCLITTIILAVWGDTNFTLTLIVCGIYGFCIAMVFPTGITWLASKIDVTGSLASAWFIGAYIGNSTYPAAAGQLITSSAGAISIMYLAAATSVAYIFVVIIMLLLAR